VDPVVAAVVVVDSVVAAVAVVAVVRDFLAVRYFIFD